MSLIDSISVDVWLYNIFPYLSTSDQFLLSQACCVLAGQSTPPDALTCSEDTIAPSAKEIIRNGTTTVVSLKPYLSTSQILSRTQKRLVMNFHASSLAIARHFQLDLQGEDFNFKPADQPSERITEQRLKEALKVNGSNLQRLVNDEMQPKSRTTEPLALNAEYLFTHVVNTLTN